MKPVALGMLASTGLVCTAFGHPVGLDAALIAASTTWAVLALLFWSDK